jgi:hypothetical protein
MQLRPINLSSDCVKADVRLGLAVTGLYTLSLGWGSFSLSCEAREKNQARVPTGRCREDCIAPAKNGEQ